MEKRESEPQTFYFNKRVEIKSKGQTTVYILLALLIVVAAVIFYFISPDFQDIITGSTEPGDFMRDCMEPALDEGMGIISKQGGYIDPEGFILYNNTRVKYLCYTSQYYVPCYVQQPMLVPHVKKELSSYLKAKAEDCVTELGDYYKNRGYEVTGGDDIGVDVAIRPGVVGVNVKAPMSFTKETSESFEEFKFGRESKMYELLMTAMSIVDFESTYGDSETTLYMAYYPELQLRKLKQIDGSTVYKIKNVKTQEEFIFASRSLAWPGGLGLTA